MQIPLHSFEQTIDETILKRGLQYFKNGYVQEPEEIGNGEFEAIVEGSENYTVNLTIKNNVVTESVCSCPYDAGPVCKHVVAVIFHLQQDELKLNEKTRKRGNTTPKPKSKTVAEQVDELLDKLSHTDLKSYISEQCRKDSTFRQLFLAKYAYLVVPDSKALYAKQIQAILKSAIGRHGYIEYSAGHFVGSAVGGLLENAQKQVETANYPTAFYIACAIMEEMTKALESADDSHGEIGGCIEPSVEIIYSIATKQIPDNLKTEIFDYCLDAFKKKIFSGWDWHFPMLDIATQLVSSAEEAKQVYALLDTVKETNDGWDWDFRKAQSIRLDLINKMEGKEAAKQYLEQNVTNSDFRKKVIETAISQKDYIKAIHLAEEGIRIDDKSKPGLADNWRNYLLKIYTIQNDTENIRKYARYLFLKANHEKKPLFDILKKHVAKENWEKYVNQLITEIIEKERWFNFSAIANIYIWEERWTDLFGIVKKHVSLNILESYDKYLLPNFTNEISDLYQTAILKFMENSTNRGYYQEACRYIRKMIKMGARDKANFVIKMLQTLYPKRKALMEELQKV